MVSIKVLHESMTYAGGGRSLWIEFVFVEFFKGSWELLYLNFFRDLLRSFEILWIFLMTVIDRIVPVTMISTAAWSQFHRQQLEWSATCTSMLFIWTVSMKSWRLLTSHRLCPSWISFLQTASWAVVAIVKDLAPNPSCPNPTNSLTLTENFKSVSIYQLTVSSVKIIPFWSSYSWINRKARPWLLHLIDWHLNK